LRIVCLSLYPHGTAPGSRFRYEQYIPLLARDGIDVEVRPFFTEEEYRAIAGASRAGAGAALAKAFARRIALGARFPECDAVWVYREAAPFGPPLVEWMVCRVLRKPLVYEFDDAIWLADGAESPPLRLARWRSKVSALTRTADHVIVGNDFLAAFAAALNPRTSVVPTTVDVENHFNAIRIHRAGVPVIGWTGSRSTNRYLRRVAGVLRTLREDHAIDIHIVSDRRLDFDFPPARFSAWSRDDEIATLLDFDIGIMPLDDTPWELGKCGLKLLEYMALGIPPVASAVGANRDIVRHGIDGFLCAAPQEWLASLSTLVNEPAMRQEMGINARRRVEESFSASAHAPALSRIFAQAAGRN
jgi:glycosyltransferase involved in cell wall biosynthesis